MKADFKSPSIVPSDTPWGTASYESAQVKVSLAEISSQTIGKRQLTFNQRRRVHLRFVALHPCLICGCFPSDAHHMRLARSTGLGKKASGEYTVPLCRAHHRDSHRHVDEQMWWSRYSIDPMAAAKKLWCRTTSLK